MGYGWLTDEDKAQKSLEARRRTQKKRAAARRTLNPDGNNGRGSERWSNLEGNGRDDGVPEDAAVRVNGYLGDGCRWIRPR